MERRSNETTPSGPDWRFFTSTVFARFNMYRLFVFIFLFIFLCTENFPSICGKFSLLKNMNWKFSVYLWEIFIAQKYELEIFRLFVGNFHCAKIQYELENKHK